MASKYIRSVTKILKATSGVLFGRKTAGVGKAEELTPSDVRAMISVYSTAEVDSIIGGIEGLTSADIDTLAEINAILTDADLASVSYVDSGLSGKQATLVSGTNIKTVNSTSLLGSGDITVSASPAGSSGQVQYNDAGAFGGATAIVYAGSGTHVTVTAQSASAVPVCVKGAASQTGNLFEARNSSNTLCGHLTKTGNFSHDPGNSGRAEQFGREASVSGYGAAFGFAATSFEYGVAIGTSAFAGYLCTAIGNGAGTTGTSGGVPSSHAFSYCLSISTPGYSGSPTANDQAIIAGQYTEFFFGKGVAHATPISSVRMQGTGGSGTNIAGSTIRWAPGRSTGNATPASFIIQRTVAESSGTTAQTLSDALQVDGNTTAGETPLLLLDIDKGTLQRVSIGAADSGGTGFKVLRIPN